MKSLNKKDNTSYTLGFLWVFDPVFIGVFDFTMIVKNVEKSVKIFIVIDDG